MYGGNAEITEFDEMHTAVPENVVSVLKALRRSFMLIYGVKSVVLFGSYAKGTFTPESDIDIAVFVDGITDFLDVFRKTSRLAAEYPLDIQVLVFGEDCLCQPIGIIEEITEFGRDISRL